MTEEQETDHAHPVSRARAEEVEGSTTRAASPNFCLVPVTDLKSKLIGNHGFI